MPDLVNIKDMSPNEDLINMLEYYLEKAKCGELRSLIGISGWDDTSVNHGWQLDDRSSMRMLLSELALAQNNFINGIEIRDGESLLCLL